MKDSPTRSRRIAAVAGAAAVAAGLGLLAGSPAQAASSAQAVSPAQAVSVDAAPWRISYVRNPPICVPSSGYGDVYVYFTVDGSWSADLTYGLSDLPGDTWMQGGTLPAGSGTGVAGLAQWRDDSYVAPGAYTLELWVSDGTTTETAPVAVKVGDDC